MASLPITISPKSRTRGRRMLRIEIDADKLEQLAAQLGFFRPEFLASLGRAEDDIHAGRVRKVASLRDLRRRKK